MAAEADARLAGSEVLAGIAGVEHIVPVGRRAGIGMDEETVALACLEGQGGEKGAGSAAKLAARPFERQRRRGIHRDGRIADRVVVVAAQHDGAARGKPHRLFRAPFGIRAIAYDIAEQHEALRPGRFRGRQHGLEGLAVGVDIGKDGEQHGGPVFQGR